MFKQAINQKEYWLVDYIKLLAAFLVVAIHTGLTISVDNVFLSTFIEFLESLAVPLFFCIAGYLLQEKLAQNEDEKKIIIKKNLNKYLKLYGMLSIAYFPLTIYGAYQSILETDNILKVLLNIVRNYLLVGEQFYSWQLWYLLAMILGLGLLFVLPYKKSWYLLVYSCISFALAYFITEFTYLRVIEFTIVNGRIFTGPSYIMLGMFVYCKKNEFGKVRGLVVPLSACLVSILLKLSYSTTNVAALVAVPWIIGYVMRLFSDCTGSEFPKACRKVSSSIFFSHMYFLFIWMYLLPIKEKGINCFLFVAGLSGLFSISICLFKRIKGMVII